MEQGMFGAFGFVIIIFLAVLAMLWFFLPFAVFGTKDKLDQLIKQNNELITLLKNSNIKTEVERIVENNNETIKKQPQQVYNTATGKMEPNENI